MSKKIVINACYGGFGLSEAGMQRYAQIKGITLYPETERIVVIYYTVPVIERVPEMDGKTWMTLSTDERMAYNKRRDQQTLNPYDFERDDPVLVQVVEELGEVADGQFAKLKIVDIPEDVSWTIEEYDGVEHVAERHRIWS